MTGTTLEGRAILVTGAGRGLGRAMATGLARAGARVAFVDIDQQVLDEALSLAGAPADRVAAFRTDLSREEEIHRLASDVTGRFGRIDVLVNCAGLSPNMIRDDFFKNPIKFWEIAPATLRRFFEVNGLAPFLLAAAIVPGMIERRFGRIINVTTSLDTMLRGGMAPYGGSKASLEAHTAIMAEDLKGTGVTANVLVPGGPANTRMIPASADFDRAALVQPDAMVAPVLWLASAASAETTGRRFLAAKWDRTLPPAQAAERASDPVGWSQLGAQTIWPDRH